MKNTTRILAALCLLGTPLAHAQVFKCLDASGKVTYQETACPPGAKGETVRAPSPSQEQPPAQGPASPKPDAPTATPATAGDPLAQLRLDCLESVMRDGKATWERVAASEPRAGAFPQQQFQASAEAFCGCLADRVKETVAPAELASKGAAAFAGFGTEALRGGQCKPTGAWERLATRQF
ncbi:MAG: DUF4124 domain-containing protein [Burkholderiales bacterium]|nr:DUF4124 domain-containing protein [Burkholderiales bacterium]